MPPDGGLRKDEIGFPVGSDGSNLIFDAENLEEARALVNGDPFWSSDEVVSSKFFVALIIDLMYVTQWDKQRLTIVPCKVVVNELS